MNECPIQDGDGGSRSTCTVDGVLELLADTRRREILAILETLEDDWIERDRLLAILDSANDEVDLTEWRTTLRHVHLPMLEARGFVDYDENSGTIRYYQCELVSDVLAAIEPFEETHIGGFIEPD